MATVKITVAVDYKHRDGLQMEAYSIRLWVASAFYCKALPIPVPGEAKPTFECEVSPSRAKKILGVREERTIHYEFGQFAPVRDIDSTIDATVRRS